MADIVFLSSEDEIEVEDIVEVYEEVSPIRNMEDVKTFFPQSFRYVIIPTLILILCLKPLEESGVDHPLIPEPLILQGLVDPEDLGIPNLTRPSPSKHTKRALTKNGMVINSI